MSEKAFKTKYPNGKIPKKSSAYGKTFICRRGCNTRTSTYTEELIWEDIYDGSKENLYKLIDKRERDTPATGSERTEKRTAADDDFATQDVPDSDLGQVTPRKKQKFGSA